MREDIPAATSASRTDSPGLLVKALGWFLWLAGCSLLAWRFVGLDEDPLPIGWSGDLLTDEGWFLKAALLKARFGFWTVAGDFNAITHNALHTFLIWLAFSSAGVSIVSARAVCTGLCAAGTLALAYTFGRRVHSWLAGGFAASV